MEELCNCRCCMSQEDITNYIYSQDDHIADDYPVTEYYDDCDPSHWDFSGERPIFFVASR